jgi:hypothetical protein
MQRQPAASSTCGCRRPDATSVFRQRCRTRSIDMTMGQGG